MPENDLAGRIRALLKRPDVTEQRMFGGICFLVNGHMTVAASPRGMLVRVGKDGHEAAIKRPNTRPMVQGKRSVPGYVYVSDEGVAKDKDLKSWLDTALSHVATLPPKEKAAPQRRRK